jgi:5-methylcytosine-specific restriction endonuclease McrBC GTP-binding regulatory subunit McrB
METKLTNNTQYLQVDFVEQKINFWIEKQTAKLHQINCYERSI